MIEKSTQHINTILGNLPKDFKVLDVGGASAPFKRANTIIDYVPFESVSIQQAKGPGEIMFRKESYFSHDICSREPFPFKDKEFDFSICSHVLEDIRDPLWVCSEIIRVSKAGYIEVPSRLYETTFNLEAKNLAGASHHRWLVDLDEKKNLRFTFKYMYAHSKVVNLNRRVYKKDDHEMYLCLSWKGSFSFYENWLNSGKEIFEYYLQKPISEKRVWEIYRKVGTRFIVIEWLSYIKNTNDFFKKLYRTHNTKK
jgi:hypothetical protein